MPLNYMVNKQKDAVLALTQFMKQNKRKMILERQLKNVGLSKALKTKYQGELNQLEFDIARNPIKPLIDEGMLNSIVEDVSLDDDTFSTRSKIADWVEGKTEKIPGPLKEAYKWVQLTRDTSAYQFLDKTTRYSDFVARYAMYEWYLEKGNYYTTTSATVKNKVRNEALQTVMETFVQYDPPTSRELQYLNDIGLWMFTKYGIRIQKTLYKLLRDKPDSVITMYAIQNYFNLADLSPFATAFGAGTVGVNPLVALSPGLNLAGDLADVGMIPVNTVADFIG
jgi:hypothetical protein